MKTFVFKIEINWLPTVPTLKFEGTQEAANEASARAAIVEFYMMELGLMDENDIVFVEFEEI